jgi:hypothetical protein
MVQLGIQLTFIMNLIVAKSAWIKTAFANIVRALLKTSVFVMLAAQPTIVFKFLLAVVI